MAKGKGTISSGTPTQLPGLRQGLRAVKTEGKQMARERTADYKLELSGVRAGQANYARQLGRAQKILGRTVSGSKSTSKRVTKMSKANARAVERAQADSVSRYGSALGASVSQQFAPARSAVQQGRVIAKEVSRSVGAGNKTAKTVAGIARQGAKAQMGAAKFALAQALQQRTILDNQTLAGLQEDLYKQGLAYESSVLLAEQQNEYAQELAKQQQKYDQENIRLQAKLDRKAAQEAANGQTPSATAAKTVVNSVAAAVPDLRQGFWLNDKGEPYRPGDTPATAKQVATNYIDTHNITDPNEMALINVLASKMYTAGAGPKSGASVSNEEVPGLLTQAVTQTFSEAYPDLWKKHGDDILGSVTSQVNSSFLNTTGTPGDPADPVRLAGLLTTQQIQALLAGSTATVPLPPSAAHTVNNPGGGANYTTDPTGTPFLPSYHP